jgi:hypothetical protein
MSIYEILPAIDLTKDFYSREDMNLARFNIDCM